MTSHKTAIKRKKLSAPMKYLLDNKYLELENNYYQLDYGCGHGFDADYLGMDKYDPYYYPEGKVKMIPGFLYSTPIQKHYNLITCNYVLNVLETKKDATKVIEDIQSHLKVGGVAYLTVRRDSFQSGKTSKGYQWHVDLDLPSVYKRSGGFEIYKLTKLDKDVKITLR